MSRRWTAEEDDLLRRLAPTTKYADIGAMIGRTKSTVCGRAYVLGVRSGRPPGVPPWPEDEVNILRELAPTMSHAEIGLILGRSPGGVKQKAHQLQIPGQPKDRWQGDEHWNWKGGHSTNYGQVWVTQVRPAVFERDQHLCQHPGCSVFSPSGHGLVAHHIVPRRLTHDDRLSNHVTLCKPHHGIQAAHKWIDVTPELMETLPEYQRRHFVS